MKIAYLSRSTLPSRAANSVHVMKMCGALASAGHEVTLVARRGAGAAGGVFRRYGVTPSFSIVKCRTPRPPWGAEALYGLAAAAKLRRIGPDVIYSRHLLSLCAAAFRWRVPLVLEVHAPPTALERKLLGWLFKRRSFRRLVVISEALRRELARLFPRLPATKIVVAHDGADPPVRSLPEPDLGLEVEGRAPGLLKVGYVGHLYPGKGMEIVAELAGRLGGYDFHVVGGTEEDLRLWRRRVAERRNLLFHGFVPPPRTDAYRRAMDVLIAPYQTAVSAAGGGDIARFMSPLKIFEYMAAEKAIVASDLPVLREVLTDGAEALLVPPGDVNAWEEALRRLEDPGLRQNLAAAAFRAFECRHTWGHRARKVVRGL